MALINCPECGKEISDKAASCPSCGCPIVHNGTNDTVEEMANSARRCPKCGSTRISYQREQSTNIGGSVHNVHKSTGHGVTYWLLIGWWLIMFKLVWEMLKLCCTCGLSLFFRKKKDKKTMKGHTVSAGKTINRTMAVCQNCGYSWKA